jgi:hypothetical protein
MIQATKKLAFSTLCVTTLALSPGQAAEATPTAPAPAAKSPFSCTLTGSFGYDSNVYLVNNGTLSRRESTLGTAGAKITAKLEPGILLSYGATASRYWDETSQDNVKHVLGAGWNRKIGDLSGNANTEFAQVDGSATTANYTGSGYVDKSGFATAAPRERGDQLQNKTDLSLRYDTRIGFVRGIGKLQYWDMQTRLVAGEKYVDRHDIQGGVDAGRAFAKGGPEYYLGYRNGHQFQDRDGGLGVDASNHYDRYLAGFDGKILPSLKLAAQAGWSIHDYGSGYGASDHREEGLYTDITATGIVTKADELQFKTSENRTVSSTGTNSVLGSTHQLNWKHTFNQDWSASLTGRLAKIDYAPASRIEVDYTAMASVTWNATKAVSATLGISRDWIENKIVTGGDSREYDRAFVSAGVTWKL